MRRKDQVEEQIDTSSNAKQSDNSVNGIHFKVLKVINTSKFIFNCDMNSFTRFERNGVVKLIKTPTSFESRPLQ